VKEETEVALANHLRGVTLFQNGNTDCKSSHSLLHHETGI